MKYRSTLVYLLAAVVLVGVYLFETRRDEKKEVAEDEAKRLFQIEARQLDLITLKRGGSSITLRKSGVTGRGSWEITAPFSAGTDRFELTRLTDRLAALKSLRAFGDEAEGFHSSALTSLPCWLPSRRAKGRAPFPWAPKALSRTPFMPRRIRGKGSSS